MQSVPDILIFFGRFHSLIVHLPIGFVTLAILLQILTSWRQFRNFKSVIGFIWLIAALSSLLAVLMGLALAAAGEYDEQMVFWHKFGGISLVIFSSVCYVILAYRKKLSNNISRPIYFFSVGAVALSLIITGHLGGSLTHGPDYLVEFAPVPFLMTDTPKDGSEKKEIKSLDSADIFKDAVLPILQTKCASCHNQEKKKGKLLLTSHDDILAGGESGPAVIPGNLATSELFRRVTLPLDHKEFMPSDGKKPLTETHLAIIEWWIETGAQPKAMISDLRPNEKMKDKFIEFFQIGKAEVLRYTASTPDENAVRRLLQNGFLVNQLAENKNLLEVKFYGSQINPEHLHAILDVKDQLVWLQLPNCGVTDQDLKLIGGLTNLFKLNLNRNKITDNGIGHLSGLKKLEYLNLYGTSITESSVLTLMKLPKLRNLFVWETSVRADAMDSLQINPPGLNLVYRLDSATVSVKK